jgi:predicted Fe-Mo cluster-binding NifX family protein
MKLALTTNGTNLEAALDPRFGRAARFLLFETATGRFTLHDNTQNLNAVQGAGIQAVETVATLGADVVLTGHCGPKAFRALQAAGIQIVTGAAGTVRDVIVRFGNGQLRPASSADVEGHWA